MKKLIALVGIITVTLVALMASPHRAYADAFAGGDGSAETPYQVATCTQLQSIDIGDLTAHYVLSADVDCSMTNPSSDNFDAEGQWSDGKGFNPIGDADHAFTGTFDGADHTISGLTILRADDTYGQSESDEEYVGLFAKTDGSSIHNLTLDDAMVKGYRYVGGVVGYELNTGLSYLHVNDDVVDNSCNPGTCVWARWGEYGGGVAGYMDGGTLTHATSGGNVKGSGQKIGGLVGYLDGNYINDSSSTAHVDGGYMVGGIVGEMNNATLGNVHSTGHVEVVEEDHKTGSYGGGLVGYMTDSAINGSYATGNVEAASEGGGLVGYASGSSFDSDHATGKVTVQYYAAGGFAALLENSVVADAYASGETDAYYSVGGFAGQTLCGSVIQDAYASGAVNGYQNVGGFSGYDGCEGVGSDFTNVYATGDVNGTYEVGGFIGEADQSELDQTYATGDVSGDQYVGGLVGFTNSTSVVKSVAEGSVTGLSYNVGGLIGNANSAYVNNSYATGAVTGQQYVGGLLGTFYGGSIQKSYSRGTVTATATEDQRAGGLIGEAVVDTMLILIAHSYSSSHVVATTSVGGLIGSIDLTDMQFYDNAYDVTATGQANCLGGQESEGCTPINANSSQIGYFGTPTNAPLSAWDFDAIWFTDYDNGHQPCLQWYTGCTASIGSGGDVSTMQPSAEDGSNIQIRANKCSFIPSKSSQKEADLDSQDNAFDYPQGFVAFTLRGCFAGETVHVTLTFQSDLNPSDVVARKYNATNHTFTTIPGFSVSQTTSDGKPALAIGYDITDGGPFDQDGLANGTIVDPAGMAKAVISAPNTGLGL